MDFEPTTQDKASPLQAISVWAERLTTPEQAREFMGEKKEAYSLYSLLKVDEVRALCLEADVLNTPLDVVWDPLMQEGTDLPDTHPGAQGHAGITGLVRPPGMEKLLYKNLRSQLADQANKNLRALL